VLFPGEPNEATPENAAAPHTTPVEDGRPAIVITEVPLGVKPVTDQSSSPVPVENTGVAVTVGGPIDAVAALGDPVTSITLIRTTLGVSPFTVFVLRVTEQVVTAPVVPVEFAAVTPTFARAAFGKIATSAQTSTNIPAP
jgi:hypothetical protein